MSQVETRQIDRDSLFLMARVKVEGDTAGVEHRVKVRNLSPGGMMAEGAVRVARGARVQVELRNIGWIEGEVAWKQDNRFGIAFAEEIDPQRARAQPSADVIEPDTSRYIHPPRHGQAPGSSRLRKI